MDYDFNYTHKTARNLIALETVQKFLNDLSKCDDIYTFNKTVLPNHSKFKKLRYRRGGSAQVYINRDEKVVIKINGVFDSTDGIPTRAIPTAVGYDEDADMLVRVQPIADVSKKVVDRAMQFFEDMPGEEVGGDAHEGNVGKYKNKYVVIDW